MFQLLTIRNKTYHGDVPEIGRKGEIFPLPKKGNLGKTTNHRWITLSAVATKLYNRNAFKQIVSPP